MMEQNLHFRKTVTFKTKIAAFTKNATLCEKTLTFCENTTTFWRKTALFCWLINNLVSSAYLEIITLISSYWFHWYLVYPYPSRNGWAIQYSRPPPVYVHGHSFYFFKFFDTQTGDGHTKCVSTFRLNITDFSRSMNSYLYSTFLYIKCIVFHMCFEYQMLDTFI